MPSARNEPLERLPLSARDPEALELRTLERAVRSSPTDVKARIALAQKCVGLYREQADPRYLGRAQAALDTLFDEPSPPDAVRLLRAVIRQSNHEFAAALTDLDVLVGANAGDPEPWLVRGVVLAVLGRYPEALHDCERVRSLAGALIGAVCLGTPLGMTGHASEARDALLGAVAASRRSSRSERAWALSALAEVEERLGLLPEASTHFDAALALEATDPYTLAAYSDLLLDRGEARRVVELLRGSERVDALLLRLAIAEARLHLPTAAERASELGARFDAARLRGDPSHRREESRYALELAKDVPRALGLARANWEVQRELGDARVLLEAALAARQPWAAGPVVDFAARVGLTDPLILRLIERVKAES